MLNKLGLLLLTKLNEKFTLSLIMTTEMRPDLADIVVEATQQLITNPLDDTRPIHRTCYGCRNKCDVVGRRLPLDERWPDRISISLEFDGYKFLRPESEDCFPFRG